MASNDVVVSVDTLGSRAQQIFGALLQRNLSVFANNRVTQEKFHDFLARFEATASRANVVYPVMTADELRLVWEELRLDEELFVFLMELNAEFRYIFDEGDNLKDLNAIIVRSCGDFVADERLSVIDPEIIQMLPSKKSLTELLEKNNWLVILAMSRWVFRSIDLTKTRIHFVVEEPNGAETR